MIRLFDLLGRLARAGGIWGALFFLLAAAGARGAVVTGTLVDTRGNPTATNLTFTPLSTPQAEAPKVIFSSVQTASTDTNGQFSMALEQGDYKVTLGANSKDAFLIAVPNDNSTNDWTSLIISALTYRYPVSPQYEEKRLKGAANGYAALNDTGRAFPAQLGAGTPGSATWLRGDGVWAALSAAELGAVTNVALASDDLTVTGSPLTNGGTITLNLTNGVNAAKIGAGDVDNTEFGQLDGVTGNLQGQLDRRVASENGLATNLTVHQTLSATNLRLAAVSAPAAPVEGDTWNDATRQARCVFQGGLKQALAGVIFTATNSVVYTNSVAETILVPAGVGGTNLPANFFTPGKSLLVRLRGLYSSPASATTVTFRFKIGGSVLTTTAFSYSTGQANKYAEVEYQMTCTGAGSGGTYVAGGLFRSQTFTYAFSSATNPQNQTLSFDTTQAMGLEVTAAHSATGCSLTINQMSIQVLH